MKEIQLKKLRLLNFKGINNLEMDFTRCTTIKGANGTGKTTVFDAFTWLLFGKDSADRKAFNIKTLGVDGKAIERLPHEVSAVIEIDTGQGSETVTLCRRYTERWVKKRGTAIEEFSGHEEERLYNEVPMSVKDWQAKIAAICDEQVFKFITNPLYFTSQKTDVQRAMLFRMAGDVSDEQIAEGNADFAALLANLTGKSMDEYKREIAAKKKRIKAEIDDIPGRIDERKRDIPQAEDWDALQESLQELTAKRDECLDQIKASDNAMKAADDERKRLYNKKNELENKRISVVDDIKKEAGKSYNEQSDKQRELRREVKDLEKGIADAEHIKEVNSGEIDRCKKKREELLAEWDSINAEQLKVDDGEFTCPTCHRRYEVSEVEARMDELTADFNKRKAERLAANNSQGKSNNSHMEMMQKSIDKANATIENNMKRIKEIQQDPLYSAELTKPDYDKAINDSEELRSIDSEIEQVKQQLAQPLQAVEPADKSLLGQYTTQIDDLKARIAKRETIERNEQRITELENSLRTQSQELAELEGIEFTIQQFTKARIEAVEGRINGMFGLVRFKLFEQQINGGEVETCVATVDGVPYPDLNNAMKINAGLDIINAISQFEYITAPIFIDNAEAVNHLLNMRAQVVRLVVTNDDVLTVTNN